MPTSIQATDNATLQATSESGRQKRGVSLLKRRLQQSRIVKALLLNSALVIAFCGVSQAGPLLTLSSSGIGGGGTAYTSSFGTVNALAVNGATVAGVTAVAETSPNGALYYLPISATLSSTPPYTTSFLTAYVSTNFTNPAALVMYACPSTGSCTSTSGYSALSTSSLAPTTLVASPGIASGPVSVGVALWVPDNNGASAFAGTDAANATVTFTLIGRKNNGQTGTEETDTLTFNLPKVTVQEAVSLTLASDPSGLTISPGSDYSMSFGTVNGLGINPGPGIAGTVTAPGGIIYYTPYLYQVAFSDFNTGAAPTQATVKVYVSMNFSHNPVVLKLEDAALSAGPYSVIGTSSGTATQITNTATDRSSTQRFLGLFVSNNNGVGTVPFSDNATLTYQLTVP